MKFLFDLFPVILFFAAFKMADIYVATAVAIGATFLQIGLLALLKRRIEPMLWVSLAIIVVFGGATLLLVGEGPLESSVKEHVRRLGLAERIRFIGSQSQPQPFFALADVVVIASVTEGLSLALLEALGLGRAVVATRVGGIVDVIEDGRNGLLVPPGDPNALADAVNHLIGDPTLAARLGAAGVITVRCRFSEALMVRETERLYFSLAAAKGLTFGRDVGARPGGDSTRHG